MYFFCRYCTGGSKTLGIKKIKYKTKDTPYFACTPYSTFKTKTGADF